ncbi:MAG TPA: thioredoxin domain-containing protein [Bacillota bacterium]|nr:thioredoxin domain-containing protein [Bacillota bacterium]
MKIVRVTAMWCMSCLAMKNIWKKVFAEYPDIEIIDFDIDFDQEKVKPYQVGQILPELIVFKEGVEIRRIIGEKSKKEMKKILEELNEKH